MSDFARIQELIQRKERPRVWLLHESTGNSWNGVVERVSPEADELTRTATVYVVVDNTDKAKPLLPKNHVVARIEGPMHEGLIVLPRDAIRDNRVFVAKNNHVELRTIKIKRTLQNLAIIESGLSAGDQVVMTNLDVIHEGANIQIRLHHNLNEELDGQRGKVARPSVADGSLGEDDVVN
jgi:multidrug efflux pump subunit AcrA (membrane-fusion protein)